MLRAKPILYFLLLLSFGCGGGKDKSDAEALATQIHQQIESGNYKALYKSFCQPAKQRATEAEFVTMMERLRDDFGALKTVTLSTYSIRFDINAGKMYILTYDADFERKKAAERLEFIRSDQGGLELYGLIFTPIN